MTTTQGQIEALRRAAIACTEAANALTAAAEVDEEELAKLYVEFPNCVATMCDRFFDKTGALLGRIRTKAAAIRALKEKP